MLLLDECTWGLDPHIAEKIRGIIKLQKKHSSILFTSHNMLEVERLCDRVAFIQNGKIKWCCSPEKIKDLYKKKSLEEVFIKMMKDDSE